VGCADGFLHLLSLTGRVLFKQRVHASALASIQCRSSRRGVHAHAALEDVVVTCADTVLRIEGADISGRSVNGLGAVQIVDFGSTADLQNVLAGVAAPAAMHAASGEPYPERGDT
jgi:hypothetical protein